MKIDILCTDGSPLDVTLQDLYGEGKRGIGVGGAEYALLTMCEGWHNAGHEVTLYNFIGSDNFSGSPWEHRHRDSFDPNADRDVLITFRTPNPKSIIAKGMKVWWSCDQYTSSDFKVFAPYTEKIVTISPFHKNYFLTTYGIRDTVSIDLPIRIDDLSLDITKEPKKCIFTSIPDRGLRDLHRMWSNTISKRVPDATLVITSDYRLWGVDERNAPYRVLWMYEPNVRFLGAVPRRELIKEQLTSQLLVYPSTYEELFCVAVAEAQASGVYPITSDVGALPTTNMGRVFCKNTTNYYAEFAFAVVELLNDPTLQQKQLEVQQKAVDRFSINKILQEWDEKVFK